MRDTRPYSRRPKSYTKLMWKPEREGERKSVVSTVCEYERLQPTHSVALQGCPHSQKKSTFLRSCSNTSTLMSVGSHASRSYLSKVRSLSAPGLYDFY